MKLIHMAFNLQMKTHSSPKTQNAHCRDIRKNLGGISIFLCVSSPSTQATKRKACVYFLDLIWGLQHISQRHSRARCLSDKTVTPVLHHRQLILWSLQKNITHYAKAINIIGGSLKKLHQ